MGGGVRVTRWIVERDGLQDYFEDVVADAVHVLGGALVFFNEDPTSPEILYASGQWRTVVKEEE